MAIFSFFKFRELLTFEKQHGLDDMVPAALTLPLLTLYTNRVLEDEIVYVYSNYQNERWDAENAPRRFFVVLYDLRRERASRTHVRLLYSLDLMLFLNPATYRVFKRTKR